MFEMKKIAVEKKTKNLLLLGSVFLCAVGIGGMIRSFAREVQSVEVPLYSYGITAGSTYQVKLKENPLYPEGVLEEGRSYSKNLAKSLDVTFRAGIMGEADAKIAADYSINGVVEGYQEAQEGRNTIYEKSIPLIEEKRIEETGKSLDISEATKIDLARFRDIADQAGSILGILPSTVLKIQFVGSFYLETSHGNTEKPFSYELTIPLGAELFTVNKPDDIQETGQISETKEVMESVAWISIALFGLLIIVALIAVAVLVRGTVDISKEEQYRRQFKKILRQYNSRFVVLEGSCPPFDGKIYPVKDVRSLVKISDDLLRPICFHLDEVETMPDQGKLYIRTQDSYYILSLQ